MTHPMCLPARLARVLSGTLVLGSLLLALSASSAVAQEAYCTHLAGDDSGRYDDLTAQMVEFYQAEDWTATIHRGAPRVFLVMRSASIITPANIPISISAERW